MAAEHGRTLFVAEVCGFCGGVTRALDAFRRAGAGGGPVYVLRELVHNSFVTGDMKRHGAIFVRTPDEVPSGATLLIGAHGVTPEVEQTARRRGLNVVDATCPLVRNLHRAAAGLDRNQQLVLHGKSGHPEAEGILGHSRAGANYLVATAEEVRALPELSRPVLLTQTTLGYHEVEKIRQLLRRRFPNLETPGGVCDASRRRQLAVEKLAARCEAVVVIGSSHSSNANELRETAAGMGVKSWLVDSSEELRLECFQSVRRLGLTAGASTPDELIRAAVARLEAFGFITGGEGTDVS